MTTDTEGLLLWRRFNEWFRARRPDYPSEWAAYQAGHAAAKAETADPVVGRWYFVANGGAATLCVDEADARESAAEADIAFPRMAPHRAVQLVPADQLAAAVAQQRERIADLAADLAADACVEYANGRPMDFRTAVGDAIRAGAKEPSDQA